MKLVNVCVERRTYHLNIESKTDKEKRFHRKLKPLIFGFSSVVRCGGPFHFPGSVTKEKFPWLGRISLEMMKFENYI